MRYFIKINQENNTPIKYLESELDVSGGAILEVTKEQSDTLKSGNKVFINGKVAEYKYTKTPAEQKAYDDSEIEIKKAEDELDKKDKLVAQLQDALARLVLGEPLTSQDIKAAEDYLGIG